MDNLFANLIDKSRRLYDIDENTLIAKNKNADKLALKYDYYGKKGYKKDRCWKLYLNLAPNKINKASLISV